jgi:hypothetical protein
MVVQEHHVHDVKVAAVPEAREVVDGPVTDTLLVARIGHRHAKLMVLVHPEAERHLDLPPERRFVRIVSVATGVLLRDALR